MAYLRAIKSLCQSCNLRTATKELVSFRNDKMGKFCSICAKRELKKLQENEKHWS